MDISKELLSGDGTNLHPFYRHAMEYLLLEYYEICKFQNNKALCIELLTFLHTQALLRYPKLYSVPFKIWILIPAIIIVNPISHGYNWFALPRKGNKESPLVDHDEEYQGGMGPEFSMKVPKNPRINHLRQINEYHTMGRRDFC